MKTFRHCAFLLAILTSLFFIVSCQNGNATIKSGDELDIFVSTDIHYMSNKVTDKGEAFQKFLSNLDGKELNHIVDITDAFLYEVQKKKPNILILSGDLTFNGVKISHLELAQKLRIIEESGTSVYVIPGNHDIANPWARVFRGNKMLRTPTISPKEFSKIYNDFGYSEAISRDKNSLSYLAAPSEDLWLLMLDTAQYKNNFANGEPTLGGYISKQTFDWIKSCSDLAKKNNAKIITVMHHNLLEHSEMLKSGYTLDNSDEALKSFKENDLSLVLSGHIHIQDIKSSIYENTTFYDIATGALCIYPIQHGVIKYSKKNGFDYITSKTDVESWAKENNIKDENLKNFDTYAKNYLQSKGSQLAQRYLSKATEYTPEEKNLMTETVQELNFKYFEGTTNLDKDKIINSRGFKLWSTCKDSFLKDYVEHINNKNNIDNNKLHVSDF